MKALRWTRSALALCVMGGLTACSGGTDTSGGEGDIAELPDPPPVVVTPPEESGITNTPLPILETFGEYTSFDQSDTIDFFSPGYKALATDNEDDTYPAFYYPTCCFFDGDNPNAEITVNHTERLGIVSDAGDPSLLVSDARISIGQTLSDLADSSRTDPKKDSTPGDDGGSGWGELDLSGPYRISFCVTSAAGSGSMTQMYVNNNTTSEADSIHGGGALGSRIFNVETASLIPGQRVEINVPGEIYLEEGGEAVDLKTAQVGTEKSFLQFRVSSGGTAIIDDLLIERQSDNGQAELPACTPFQPASVPDQLAAPSTRGGDTNMLVSWDSTLNASSYDLAYGTSADIATATLVSGLEENAHTLTELENGTEYFVWVRGVNNVGPGDWSAPASDTPQAPVGANCVPTAQVDPSPGNMITWNVYDGCTHPGESGAVVVNGSSPANFEFSDEEEPFFSVSDQGVMTLDSREISDSVTGDLSGVLSAATYPKTFTWLARIDTPLKDPRGFEIETSFGEADGRRVKVLLRPDDGDHPDGQGRIQLEDFLAGDDIDADVPLDDGFHVYHVTLTLNNPSDVSVKVYMDGEDITALFDPDITAGGEGDDSGSSSSRLRIGDGSGGNAYYANVDWIVWSDDPVLSGLTPEDLVGELPEGIGELGAYTSNPWTGQALDLAGDSGTEASGSIVDIAGDTVTFEAAGGNLSSDSHRIYFFNRTVTGDFTFTARLDSVALPTAPGKIDNNAYRYGIMAMENIDSVGSNYGFLGRWLAIGHFTLEEGYQGSRTVKTDVGADEGRSRSSDDHGLGDYLRITRTGNAYTLESSVDGDEFRQLKSGSLENENGNPIGDTWHVGLFAAPGDQATFTFDSISVE
ncbi:fibronectin type III domain-containing protein [Microbulbifer litoralis]|uniref:fibronectin type III domain-containing protein n=1 Tax=Microbulbifer litoralis TaxID=2933965 RepID=UPI002027D9EC|nr:fibronectin type III domain-containing protein [Microbulbifer sp. GX H0434]